MWLENDKYLSVSVQLLKYIWLSETYLNLDSTSLIREPAINKIFRIFGFDAHEKYWNKIIFDNSLSSGKNYNQFY